MKVYIASSWKNQHAVEMLTALIRAEDIEVLSFVENNHGETNPRAPFAAQDENGKDISIEEWIWSERGKKSFVYDTTAATTADLVIYVSPSGCDAWAEIGAAWQAKRPIIGLMSKGEQVGLMRRMFNACCTDYRKLMVIVRRFKADLK